MTLVEYADLKCPICQQFALGALPKIVADYVRTGKVKMEVRIQTFLDGLTQGSPDSTNAATMATAVGFQNKLWNFMDLFYVNQKDEGQVYATNGWLTKLGSSVSGLDVKKAFTDRLDPRVGKQLTEASTQFNNDGFDGTPSFMIGKTGGKLSRLTYTIVDSPDEYISAIETALK
ncbi:MAG: thioredoxin domain-containing protein [Thermoleophilia bacterium]|nr:thioredoxin domain-containing protein [Thermoleophilia bacterium]